MWPHWLDAEPSRDNYKSHYLHDTCDCRRTDRRDVSGLGTPSWEVALDIDNSSQCRSVRKRDPAICEKMLGHPRGHRS